MHIAILLCHLKASLSRIHRLGTVQAARPTLFDHNSILQFLRTDPVSPLISLDLPLESE